jgi:predicted metalloprotease
VGGGLGGLIIIALYFLLGGNPDEVVQSLQTEGTTSPAAVGYLEWDDIGEGLNAASAVGDDRIRRQTQGDIVQDAFTHGTSEQRVRRFKKGLETGDINQGDTFGADIL